MLAKASKSWARLSVSPPINSPICSLPVCKWIRVCLRVHINVIIFAALLIAAVSARHHYPINYCTNNVDASACERRVDNGRTKMLSQLGRQKGRRLQLVTPLDRRLEQISLSKLKCGKNKGSVSFGSLCFVSHDGITYKSRGRTSSYECIPPLGAPSTAKPAEISFEIPTLLATPAMNLKWICSRSISSSSCLHCRIPRRIDGRGCGWYGNSFDENRQSNFNIADDRLGYGSQTIKSKLFSSVSENDTVSSQSHSQHDDTVDGSGFLGETFDEITTVSGHSFPDSSISDLVNSRIDPQSGPDHKNGSTNLMSPTNSIDKIELSKNEINDPAQKKQHFRDDLEPIVINSHDNQEFKGSPQTFETDGVMAKENGGSNNDNCSDEDDIFHNIKSRPRENGNWNPRDPLAWTASFGKRSPKTAARLSPLIQISPPDTDNLNRKKQLKVPGITIVHTKEEALIVLQKLKQSSGNENIVHACDTEVMDIDLSQCGPIGNGYVTCVSIYSGPTFDYGLGQELGSMLWIDNLDESKGVLQIFREWFEDEKSLKIWHNYGFDRHVLYNEGIDVRGFGGDTMHMARLYDTSRLKYSLESLTEELLKRRKEPMKELFGEPRLRKDGSEGALVDLPPVERLQRDEKFREKWITYSARDAKYTYDLYQYLREKELTKKQWIFNYNMMDYYNLHMRPFGELLTDLERRGMLVAKDYLSEIEEQARIDRETHLQIFRQWAYSKIGADGLAMNVASSTQLSTFLFGGAMNPKTKEPTEKVRVFKTAREDVSEEAMEEYRKREEQQTMEHGEKETRKENVIADDLDLMKASQLKALCKEFGLKVSGRKTELQHRLRTHFLSCNTDSTDGNANSLIVTDDYDSLSLEELQSSCFARGISPGKKKKPALIKELRNDDTSIREWTAQHDTNNIEGTAEAYKRIASILENGQNGVLKEIMTEIKTKQNEEPKYIDVTITSLGMIPEKFTAGGSPSATADVIKRLAGNPFADPPKYGAAYDFFGGGQAGHDACVAFFSLTAIGSIDTMIANFLTSLQTLADEQNRVHCSLNLNTETGRLSSRKPNLQNQPALEKDTYKIRKAFISSPGNKLIVADYGQLELRLLASMTDCTSMIEAFEAGGDFHSRTALGMFPYIQEAVKNGECLLEWDYQANQDKPPPKPMLKDMFASERRKAKTLNFSIAYGKTAHGLSRDWGVSLKEAEEMLDAWYNSRPEVLKWQQHTKKVAKDHLITRTLMGRYRNLPHAKSYDRKRSGHAERASINTPIQGGAADVVMMAMLKINNSPMLKRLGWVLLMQVHDEVILEGPEETAEEAFEEVIKCMQDPWVLGLTKTKVPLLVDGSCTHDNWYDAK